MESTGDTAAQIAELLGTTLALQAGLIALLRSIPLDATGAVLQELQAEEEAAETVLLNSPVQEVTRDQFSSTLQSLRSVLDDRARIHTLLAGRP